MPTYEYRCKDCGHEFETVQSFTDDALTECPVCHGALRKVFGSVGISFKGSGFYKTDHGARAKSGAADSSSADTKSDSKSDAKSDTTKSDTKSDTKSGSNGSSSPSSSSGSSSGSSPASSPA
jgi:putative FmdB family regulatory protein